MRSTVAEVASLQRHPVKSMLGETLGTVEVTRRGLSGDRSYAVVDAATGKVASAKSPRKWARLLEFRSSLVSESEEVGGHPLRISFPGGVTVSGGHEDLDALLSDELGHEVSLLGAAPKGPVHTYEYDQSEEGVAEGTPVTDERMPKGTFFDDATIHILSTTTLGHLERLHPRGGFEAQRFRPNVLLDLGNSEKGFVEELWVGRTLQLGDKVRLRVDGSCPRCVMVNLPQQHLPKDPSVLRAVARHNGGRAGVYATVLSGGYVSAGDEVSVV